MDKILAILGQLTQAIKEQAGSNSAVAAEPAKDEDDPIDTAGMDADGEETPPEPPVEDDDLDDLGGEEPDGSPEESGEEPDEKDPDAAAKVLAAGVANGQVDPDDMIDLLSDDDDDDDETADKKARDAAKEIADKCSKDKKGKDRKKAGDAIAKAAYMVLKPKFAGDAKAARTARRALLSKIAGDAAAKRKPAGDQLVVQRFYKDLALRDKFISALKPLIGAFPAEGKTAGDVAMYAARKLRLPVKTAGDAKIAVNAYIAAAGQHRTAPAKPAADAAAATADAKVLAKLKDWSK